MRSPGGKQRVEVHRVNTPLLPFPKVLTLASNERIPLNPTMRLVFEISHLRTATPATVSRAGSPGFPSLSRPCQTCQK